MKCPRCQNENPEDRKFCKECGFKLLLVCPKCQHQNVPGDKFCGECGYNLTITSATTQQHVEIPPEQIIKDRESTLIEENKTEIVEMVSQINVTIEKDQEIVSSPDIEEDPISESIAQMEKVFARLDAMHGAIESLPSGEQKDMLKNLSLQVAGWLETETAVAPAYKEKCLRLQKLAFHFIRNGFFVEAHPIIDTFSKIYTGKLKKDVKEREISLEVLRHLASDDNINIIFKQIKADEKKGTPGASYILYLILGGFSDIIINKLLNSLQDTADSKERISIIHVIEEIGQRAIPTIKERITSFAPWYFLRNLAYILGRIGNENNVDILRPLLLHKDKRVCVEAFKSIGLIGGNKKGSLFLSALNQVNQELKINIIETLGKIRCTEAVPKLLDMLKDKSSMAENERISLQVKICDALGIIGANEAVKTLTEIAESKSFLGIKSSPDEIRHAAKRALASIKRKQA
ncbi:MAG: HEAT repeat domain-containing protein [Syntrophaceae bacterium]|nr:HEAT repeat domain-containing protein [Syntrophaceae bacterium]